VGNDGNDAGRLNPFGNDLNRERGRCRLHGRNYRKRSAPNLTGFAGMADCRAESPATALHGGHGMRIPDVALEETECATSHCRLQEQEDQRGKAIAAACARVPKHPGKR